MRIFSAGVGGDLQHYLRSRRTFEQTLNVVGASQVLAIDGENEISLFDFHSRFSERRVRSRIPVLTRIDPLEPVTAVDDIVVGPQETARHVMRAWNCASRAAQVAD